MKNFVLENQQWLISGGVVLLVAAIIRIIPKEKLLKASLPWSGRMGRLLSFFLKSKLGERAAEKIEEGIFVTLLYVAIENLKCFMSNMLADNKGYAKKIKETGVQTGAVILLCFLAFGCNKKSTVIEDSFETVIEKLEDHTPVPEKRDPVEPTVAAVIGTEPITVLFEFDSDKLSDNARKSLSAWAEKNKGAAVVVMGGCCPIGTEDYNDALGMKRARAVATFLSPRGVIIADVQSWGENAIVSEDSALYYLSRRAEAK